MLFDRSRLTAESSADDSGSWSTHASPPCKSARMEALFNVICSRVSMTSCEARDELPCPAGLWHMWLISGTAPGHSGDGRKRVHWETRVTRSIPDRRTLLLNSLLFRPNKPGWLQRTSNLIPPPPPSCQSSDELLSFHAHQDMRTEVCCHCRNSPF